MSQASPIGSAAAIPPLQHTIARAAQATGVDFDFLLAQARIESALDPSARAATSSAAGLYQFTGGTWLATLERHGTEHGLDWASQAIDGGKVRDPEMRARLLALRFDPAVSAVMAGELAGENRATLAPVLGREPDSAELYLAHFLGAGGASRLLGADPSASAAALLPDAAQANRAVFYTRDGAPRSAGAVIELVRGKLDAAMAGSSSAARPGEGFAPPAWYPAAAISSDPAPQSVPRPSMAEALATAFTAIGSAAPDHVRAAYGKLRAFGL